MSTQKIIECFVYSLSEVLKNGKLVQFSLVLLSSKLEFYLMALFPVVIALISILHCCSACHGKW